MSWLVNVLKRQHVIRVQMTIYFCFAHIYYAMKNHYEHTYDSRSLERFKSSNKQEDSDNCSKIESYEHEDADANVTRLKILSSGVHETNNWDWQGFPKVWKIFRLYQKFTTVYMMYVVIKYMLPGVFTKPVELIGPKLPPHCYILGRFMLHLDWTNKSTATILSLYHLLWRVCQYCFSRPYSMDAVSFMMLTDHDVHKFYRLFQMHSYLINNNSTQDKRATGFMDAKSSESLHLDADCQQEWAVNEYPLSKQEHFMRQVMCYKSSLGKKVVYKLRQNRTIQARKMLATLIAKTTVVCSSFFFIVTIIVTTWTAISLLPDDSYIAVYPNCDPSLEELNNQGKLGKFSITLSVHRLSTMVLDAIENFVIWTESGYTTFTLAMVNVLNYDLILCWRNLNAKIEKALLRVRVQFYLAHNKYNGKIYWTKRARLIENTCDECSQYNLFDWLQYDLSYCYSYNFENSTWSPLVPSKELDNLIQDIQAETFDFFQQIKRTDLFVSDILTATLLIWLSGFAIFNYLALNYYWTNQKVDMPIFVFTIQVVNMVLITFASHRILILHKCSLKSYKSLCSLMTYYQSKRKSSFLAILDLYTTRTRYFYTLFQHYPLSPTTFMSVLGWTLSCFMIFENLFIRRR